MARSILIRTIAAICLIVSSGCSVFGETVFVAQPDDQFAETGAEVSVEFTGAERFSSFRLRRVIEDRMIDLSRRPDSEAIAQDAAFDLEDHYRGAGYPDVSVTFQKSVTDDDEVRVTFEITEGSEVLVASRSFPGAKAFERQELERLWLRRGSGTFGLGPPLFVQSDIDGFATSLRLFYRTSGYLAVEVRRPEIARTVEDEQPVVHLQIRIDEGQLYHVGTVAVASELEAAVGSDLPQLATGTPATATAVETFRRSLLKAIRDRGYPDVDLEARLSRDDEACLVHVEIAGSPGRRAEIGSIRIAGNGKTDDEVILDRLRIEPGSTFDGSALDEGLRELYLTGLFRRVEITHEWQDVDPTDPAIVDLNVDVEEEQSQSFEALAGWGSYERLRGKLRYEEANLFGSGRALAVEGRASFRGYRGVIGITDPAIFGTRNELSVNLDVFEREEPSYVDRARGGTVALSRELAHRLNARVGYTYRQREGATIDVVDPAAALSNFTEGSVFLELRNDRRDSVIYPRDGHQLSMQLDGNHPSLGSDVQFARLGLAGSLYVPLGEDVSLALRGATGWIWPGEASERVPIQVRWFNGGESTVRSFQESGLGPVDANGEALGGEYRNLVNAELRARILPALEAAIFGDAGNLGSRVDDYGLANLRYAVGVGMRLALPIGPVRADAAWNPDQRVGEEDWVLHLSVGYPF